MFIYYDTDSAQEPEIADRMQQAAMLCAGEENLEPAKLSLSVTFADADEIRRLNREYRQVDEVTDVLSFPQFDDIAHLPDSREIHLGDVVICLDAAEQQALEYGHTLERELIYLFTHSVFHLLGYNHLQEDDKKKMREKEESVLAKMGLSRDDTGGDILE
jgi:probable rRNA maturation factor